MHSLLSCISSITKYANAIKLNCEETGCIARPKFNGHYKIFKADDIETKVPMCDYIIFFESKPSKVGATSLELKSGEIGSDKQLRAILCKFENGTLLGRQMIKDCKGPINIMKSAVRQLFVGTYSSSEYRVWAKKYDIKLKRCGEWIDAIA